MFELTEAQRQELQQPEPVAVDPLTKETYVLVRKVVYDRLKGLVYEDKEFPIREAYPLMDEMAAKAGWMTLRWICSCGRAAGPGCRIVSSPLAICQRLRGACPSLPSRYTDVANEGYNLLVGSPCTPTNRHIGGLC